MADLLDLAARYVDGAPGASGTTNPVDRSLHELADGLALVASFSHILAFDGGDGLVLFDTSLERAAPACLAALRTWSTERVSTVVYTHGHFDHVGGAGAILAEAEDRADPRPQIVGHERVGDRFARYELTNGYNAVINKRQFGAFAGDRFGPEQWVPPDTTFSDRLAVASGGLRIELNHALGETDDHAWAWIPEHRAVCAGDFVTWVFPNAGNPQKVQRYPIEWAGALRAMAVLRPALLLGAHGLPIAGEQRIQRVLDELATALESLVHQTLERMNAGLPLNQIVHEVSLPDDLLDRPYLRPIYDEPEFVVNNIWRLYGGWYDGAPDRLKPAPDNALAAELAALAGGPRTLAARAQTLSEAGSHRLACHLVELASRAAPDDGEVHGIRALVYRARVEDEMSLMAKGIFGWAASESEAARAD